MSDVTPRDPEPRDADLSARLMATEPPAHAPDFWNALDGRIELVATLRALETPEHLDGFWASVDARVRAESFLHDEITDTVVSRPTVFDDDLPLAMAAASRHRRHHPRRLEHLVQLSAAAAIVAVLAGALAWWGTRDRGEQFAGAAPTTVSTTTVPVGPPTSAPAPPLFNNSSHVQDSQPAAAHGSVPVGASPDGKYLYVAGPAQSDERCTFGATSNAGSTAAMWLYAQPVDGSASHRILTDRVFADPKMAEGPNDKVVVSDSCNGTTTHVIASAQPNGALSVDRVVPSAPTAPLAVDGVAWSAGGTGLFLRGQSAAGWFRYDLASAALTPAPDIAPDAIAVEQLANLQIVSVARLAGSAMWSVSVGAKEVAALAAPAAGDVARAVEVDARHGQLAVAGRDKLLVLTARPADDVSVASFQYAAQAVAWAADGNGLVAAPATGGLEYLSFAPTADNHPSAVSLGFDGVAYSLLSVPDSSSLVVRPAIAQGDALVAGEALLLKLTSG